MNTWDFQRIITLYYTWISHLSWFKSSCTNYQYIKIPPVGKYNDYIRKRKKLKIPKIGACAAYSENHTSCDDYIIVFPWIATFALHGKNTFYEWLLNMKSFMVCWCYRRYLFPYDVYSYLLFEMTYCLLRKPQYKLNNVWPEKYFLYGQRKGQKIVFYGYFFFKIYIMLNYRKYTFHIAFS